MGWPLGRRVIPGPQEPLALLLLPLSRRHPEPLPQSQRLAGAARPAQPVPGQREGRGQETGGATAGPRSSELDMHSRLSWTVLELLDGTELFVVVFNLNSLLFQVIHMPPLSSTDLSPPLPPQHMPSWD